MGRRLSRRHGWSALLVFAVAVVAANVASATGGARHVDKSGPDASAGAAAAVPASVRVRDRWYAPDSPWNLPVGNASVLPQSSAWMASLYGAIGQINLNKDVWTPTVVLAGAKAPRRRVSLSDGWVLDDVPLPDMVSASGDTDGHAVIVDAVRKREYDFLRLARDPNGSWRASSGVVLRLNGSGWYNGRHCSRGVCGPWGARASSAALGGGLIRTREMASGVIRHALACSAPLDLIGPAVVPATTSDGRGRAGAMPMGSRLQLDPGVDITSLGLQPGEEILVRALQTYGAYIVDSSSAFACYAQNTSTQSRRFYPESWNDGLSKELVTHMRVVVAPRVPSYDSRAVFGQPHR